MKHNFYKTGDKGAPDAILDRNGQVALNMCRHCRQAAGGLEETCPDPLGLGAAMSARTDADEAKDSTTAEAPLGITALNQAQMHSMLRSTPAGGKVEISRSTLIAWYFDSVYLTRKIADLEIADLKARQ